MPPRKKMKKSTNRLPLLPYARAMKAYAYADKPFRFAMEQLGYLHLEVPRYEVDSHAVYWEQMRK